MSYLLWIQKCRAILSRVQVGFRELPPWIQSSCLVWSIDARFCHSTMVSQALCWSRPYNTLIQWVLFSTFRRRGDCIIDSNYPDILHHFHPHGTYPMECLLSIFALWSTPAIHRPPVPHRHPHHENIQNDLDSFQVVLGMSMSHRRVRIGILLLWCIRLRRVHQK